MAADKGCFGEETDPFPPSGTSPNLGEESKRNLYSEGGVIWWHRVSRRDEVCDIFCGLPFV